MLDLFAAAFSEQLDCESSVRPETRRHALILQIKAFLARWGLADSSHFSRLFRATYGMSPREFRSEKITLA